MRPFTSTALCAAALMTVTLGSCDHKEPAPVAQPAPETQPGTAPQGGGQPMGPGRMGPGMQGTPMGPGMQGNMPMGGGPGMRGNMPMGGGGPMMRQLRAGCPMVVDEASVAAEDTDGGVALTFKTDGGDVSGLRQRARHMAQMYEMRGTRRGMMWHGYGRGRGHMRGPRGGGMGMGPMHGAGPMPAANAAVEDVDGGARVVLTPADASDLDALRKHVRWHQQRMESGQCWMWSQPSKPSDDGSPDQGGGTP